LIALYKRETRELLSTIKDNTERKLHVIALAELIGYIEENRSFSDVAPVFKVVELAKLYTTYLEQLGVDTSESTYN
jgi:hypothetical protein